MMARLETITFLVVVSYLIHTASSSAILNYFSSRESSQADVDDDLVPEVYGGALTDFFQTLSVVGEGESSDDYFQSVDEDDLENILELDIDVEEFLLVTDHELKARPRSDIIGVATSSAVELDQKSSDDVDMSSGSVSPMSPEIELPVSTSLLRFSQTLHESRESPSTTTLSTTSEPSISTNSTEINDLASDSSTSARVSNLQLNSTPNFSNQQTVSTLDKHPSLFESSLEVNDVATPTGRAFLPASENDPVAASDNLLLHQQPLEVDPEFSKLSLDSSVSPTTTVLSSLSSPSADSIMTEHTVKFDEYTTSFDDLLLALEKLDTLNEAVEDLHTSQDQSIQTDSNDHTSGVHEVEMQDVAQDRTDMVENNDEDDSDGFFSFLYTWLA